MPTLYLDFETYSEAKLPKVGSYVYASDKSTEALMLAWAVDQDKVEVWDIFSGDPMPEKLHRAINDGDTLVSAFNATFERLILRNCLGITVPPERFRCTMVRTFGLSFTGRMEEIAERFGLPINKDPRGHYLIMKFSKPQPKNQKVRRWTAENAPEEWEEFKEYCRQDVVVERALAAKCAPYHFPEEEWERYAMDQRVNDYGVPVDRVLVSRAIEIDTVAKTELKDKMRDLTGLDNPNSRAQLMRWLGENGVYTEDIKAETLRHLIDSAEDERILAVLTMKAQLSKTSATKWKAFKRSLGGDGAVHGMFQFMGASRTGRWAGRLVQLQNLARGGNTTKYPAAAAAVMLRSGYEGAKVLYGNVMELLSDTIRCAITAPEGKILNVSDLSSIESRVLGWISDCQEINSTFTAKKDTYKVFATRMYRVPYEQVTKQQRTFSKPPVLGGGYMLGAKGLMGYAEGMGVAMTEEEAQTAIDVLRSGWPDVVAFWKWCKDAVFYTTRTGNDFIGRHGLKTFAHGEFLFIRLPSGRNLAYHKPEIRMKEAPWGGMIDNFTYMGLNRFNYKWERVSAHAGGVTENIVQAIARDILIIWMERVEKAGFRIAGHVHDEIITVEDRDRVDEMNDLIRKPISWAEGLLLDADGYTTKRYKKG